MIFLGTNEKSDIKFDANRCINDKLNNGRVSFAVICWFTNHEFSTINFGLLQRTSTGCRVDSHMNNVFVIYSIEVMT